ncbi:MAG: hypothetical protein U0869_06295 [Chloroflexota bacterium]
MSAVLPPPASACVFELLSPTGSDYATRPIAEAFDWSAVARPEDAGAWALVVFRSIRRADADEARLVELDEAAHQEAAAAPGFVHYFKGPLAEDRSCLSFCLWADRAAARNASAGPLHRAAVTITADSYERYALELYRVVKVAGERGFRFEALDRHA